MAESRKAKSGAGPGWLATLLGGLVLVALGFGLGLVAGAAYEEPKLVAEHIAGRTVDVPLPAPAEAPAFGAPAEEQAVLEEPLRAAAPPPEPVREPVRELPPPEPPPVAAAPSPADRNPTDGFRIQVGAFGDIEGARKLRGELRAAGFPTEIHEVGSGARFKVRVGPIPTRGEAEATARKLETKRKLPTWILAPGRG